MMKRKRKSLILSLLLIGAMVLTGTFNYIPASAENDETSSTEESSEVNGDGQDNGVADNEAETDTSNSEEKTGSDVNTGDGTVGSEEGNDDSGEGTVGSGEEGNTGDEDKSNVEEDLDIGVSYYTHVQTYGDQDPVTNGVVSGTIGESKRLEGISISLTGLDEADKDSHIQYMTQVQTYGWEDDWSNADGEVSGTSGESKRLEAIRMQLTGPVAEKYDVYYRVHCQSYGWLSWAKNGEYAGSEGLSKRLEAIQIILVDKDTKPPKDPVSGVTSGYDNSYVSGVMYRTHVQNVGWQSYVENGTMSGTTGSSYRLEAINIKLTSDISGGIQYRTHIQSDGWEKNWVKDDGLSGTSGQSKRLEAIQINLTGEAADTYDVYYRVHCQSYGWLEWAKNGEYAGSEGLGKRLEGIQIVLVEKDGKAPADLNGIKSEYENAYVTGALYRTHVQTDGWQSYVGNGETSGTSGRSLRLEGINIKLTSDIEGGIRYKTHVQSYGWETKWTANGGLSGTSGKSKRLEAIKIELNGDAADNYDVYYRVHSQTYGWLGWAKNGEPAGTEGYSKRLEAIEIQVLPKGSDAPGSTENAFKEYYEDLGKELLDLVNTSRETIKVDPLEWDEDLYQICLLRLEELKEKFDSKRPDGTKFETIFAENNYSFTNAGQNYSKFNSTVTPAYVMNYWKTSDNSESYMTQVQKSNYEVGAVATDGKYWVYLAVEK
ncbi:MAG: CAP domain-containing protein [Lachnospiraceae bacterium]